MAPSVQSDSVNRRYVTLAVKIAIGVVVVFFVVTAVLGKLAAPMAGLARGDLHGNRITTEYGTAKFLLADGEGCYLMINVRDTESGKKTLRPLRWFALLEYRREDVSGSRFEASHFYRKAPLFDRFLSFDVRLEAAGAPRH